MIVWLIDWLIDCELFRFRASLSLLYSSAMGISWVLIYPTPEGKTFNQALDDLGKQLTSQGCEKDQSYTVQCETYFPVVPLANPKIFHVILDSDRPASCFLVSDKDPVGCSIVAERAFLGFLGKLTKAYGAKKPSNVEVNGTSYLFHDFTIRPGVLTLMGSARCIVLEVELRSCPVLITAAELMKEFISTLLPNPLETPPPYLVPRLSAGANPYSHLDTVLQYYDIFNGVRKNQAVQKWRFYGHHYVAKFLTSCNVQMLHTCRRCYTHAADATHMPPDEPKTFQLYVRSGKTSARRN